MAKTIRISEQDILLTSLIDKTKQEAANLIAAAGFEMRITQEDEQNFLGTCDLRFDRINLVIKNNTVTRVTIG